MPPPTPGKHLRAAHAAGSALGGQKGAGNTLGLGEPPVRSSSTQVSLTHRRGCLCSAGGTGTCETVLEDGVRGGGQRAEGTARAKTRKLGSQRSLGDQ